MYEKPRDVAGFFFLQRIEKQFSLGHNYLKRRPQQRRTLFPFAGWLSIKQYYLKSLLSTYNCTLMYEIYLLHR